MIATGRKLLIETIRWNHLAIGKAARATNGDGAYPSRYINKCNSLVVIVGLKITN